MKEIMTELITSSSNSKIKLVRMLQGRQRSRKKEEAFVAEGVRLLEEAVAVNWPFEFVLYDETLSERGLKLLDQFRSLTGPEAIEITPQLMTDISDTETPQGILGVLKRQPLPLPDDPDFIILADQIRDPGNLGTLLRTAEAAAADAVLLSPGTVDAFSPKVLRAGMGAHFHLPIQHLPWETLNDILQRLPVYLATAENGTLLWEADFTQPCALLIGGEAFGASPMGEEKATHKVMIPMQGRAESLNAAIAAGILIAEVLRQRYQTKKE